MDPRSYQLETVTENPGGSTIRLRSWQPFAPTSRHPLLGASRSHRISREQDLQVRKATPALYGHLFVGWGNLRGVGGAAGGDDEHARPPRHVKSAVAVSHARDLAAFGVMRLVVKNTRVLREACSHCHKRVDTARPHDCVPLRAVATHNVPQAVRAA